MANETIVLIHGMWMTPHSWDHWIDHFNDRGYRAIAPGWPGVSTPDETRRDPSGLKGLGLKRIVDHYDGLIRALDSPPIIMGHSYGGLTTQLLLDRGLGAAGVAIATAPPMGIFPLPVSTLRSGLPALKNPFNRNGLAGLSRKQFRYRFTNTVRQQESDRIYDEHYIPGTNRAFFDSLGSSARITYTNPARPPLLLAYGTEDHISPPAVNNKVLKRQSKAPSATAAKEYAGRPHFLAGLDGWEDLADDALNWALEHSAAAKPQSTTV
jgi:alpha-beta hydrolase superfamily lysophospholipase